MSEKASDINNKLNEIFREVFDDESIVIFDEMVANDIEEWDSLTHIILVVAIEKEFGIQLNAAEVGEMKNVGEMVELLDKHLSGNA